MEMMKEFINDVILNTSINMEEGGIAITYKKKFFEIKATISEEGLKFA